MTRLVILLFALYILWHIMPRTAVSQNDGSQISRPKKTVRWAPVSTERIIDNEGTIIDQPYNI